MPKPKILITKRFMPDAVAYLSERAELDYVQTDEGLTAAELIERSRGKQAVITQVTDRIDRTVMDGLKGVSILSHLGVGYDNIDVAAATDVGIMVSNTPGVLDDTTADLAFALMLSAARRIPEGHQYIRDGKWKRWILDLMIGHDVHHSTLGILGMGRIGQAVARRGRGFSMRILYHNRNRLPEAVERELSAEWVTKERLLAESDFVSIHLPLTAESRGAIGEAELRSMKPSAILINTARGPIVKEEALVRALQQGWIAAAGLDVFEREPAIEAGLADCPNVVMSPHIGSSTIDTRNKMAMMVAENAIAAVEGRRPPNLVNPAVWDQSASRKASGE